MAELLILKCFLFVSFLFAPLMTKEFFLKGSRVYADAHKISLLVLLLGAALNINYLVVVWPLFCALGFFLYLKDNYQFTFSAKGAAGCIPFIFSLISSVWFLAAIFDLHLLGYNRWWSFYAALHGSFLGWIFVGCLVVLSKRMSSERFYLCGCYLVFLFFLFVAFGIDGIPYIKRIVVLGICLLMPLLIGHYTLRLKTKNHLSLSLAWISFLSVVLSMLLAILNEFWTNFPKIAFGFPVMVLAHGSLNALFAVPCFFLAVRFERSGSSNETRLIERVVFFDDLCVLCSGTVILLTKIDGNRKLKFSSLQGKFGQTLLRSGDLDSKKSVIFWSNGASYDRAEAVIHILLSLGGIYKFTGCLLMALPVCILNILYDFIARHRYQIFGKNKACLSPTDEIKDLFIP